MPHSWGSACHTRRVRAKFNGLQDVVHQGVVDDVVVPVSVLLLCTCQVDCHLAFAVQLVDSRLVAACNAVEMPGEVVEDPGAAAQPLSSMYVVV